MMKINRTALIICLIGFFCSFITQNQSFAQEKSEATMELSYFKKADMSKSVVAVIRARNQEGKFAAAQNAEVSFFVMQKEELLFLQKANTDNKGQAVLELQESLPLDSDRFLTIVAKIENNKQYEDTEEQVSYKDANLRMSLNSHDSLNFVNASVTEIDIDGKEVPVEDAEVRFYVQRMFGIMPAAEYNALYTDENGQVSFNFPDNIPGDTAGVINLVVRIEDDEQFGNVENQVTSSWGTVLLKEANPFPRALSEPFAPWPLIITISIIFTGVWCTYFFIFFQLKKIKEE